MSSVQNVTTKIAAVLPSKSWRRFSLRTLLIVVTLLSVYLGRLQHRVHREYEAVQDLVRRGYRFQFAVGSGFHYDEGRVAKLKDTGGLLEFLRKGLGREWEHFGVVESAWTPHDSQADDVALLLDISRLKGVGLRGPAITDQELQELVAPRRLKSISFERCALTKASVSILKQHDELRQLSFQDVRAIPYKEHEQYELMMALPNCDVRGSWPIMDELVKRRIERIRAVHDRNDCGVKREREILSGAQ